MIDQYIEFTYRTSVPGSNEGSKHAVPLSPELRQMRQYLYICTNKCVNICTFAHTVAMLRKKRDVGITAAVIILGDPTVADVHFSHLQKKK